MLIRKALVDPLNTELRSKILDRRISANSLVCMNEVEFLNPEARMRIEKARAERMEQKTVEYIERLTMTETTLFKCPSCGCSKCYANFRSTDYVKWQGDDPAPTLLKCTACSFTFKE
ncbi:transcription elongation factor [Strigomonas culicis]|nr:transcription elongation factor [Strigomonas culicis]|eukprot:EPY31956.1 transcription elongation factor [Strigomonas culicis]